MQCTIYSDVPYLKIPEMISNQRKVITDKVSELTSGHVQHTGIDWSKGAVIDINNIPGIRNILLPSFEHYFDVHFFILNIRGNWISAQTTRSRRKEKTPRKSVSSNGRS